MILVGLNKSFKTFNLNKQLVQITISNLNNDINPIFHLHAHVHDHFECQYLFKGQKFLHFFLQINYKTVY